MAHQFKIVINKNKCTGCGSCVALCDNFEIGEDGKSRVKVEEVEGADCNQIAAESCPMGAIAIKRVRS
ncbi:MAG: Ferredoxin [Parcubacteria group bacterium ADurb.Bin159]|jgi:ferredoxin|nr:MAG: Ferredoxin [Parcubacteria group bacterium ADurb.Bin159]